MEKRADTDHPVHDLVAERWSPCGFSDRPVAESDLLALFEAARWAPSSYNEQPWRYLVATRDDPEAHERLLSCLVEANRDWAGTAPVLALGCAAGAFSRNGEPNRHAFHDLGQATATLAIEATSRGLKVHQMAGILPDRAREVFDVPGGFEVVTAFAIGHAAEDPEALPEPIRRRDLAPRSRRPLGEVAFRGAWGRALEG